MTKKISELPASAALTGAELVEVTQAGGSRRTTAAAIAALGLANPMTTAGDLIVGGASGAPTRLAVGAGGQVLGIVGGVPTWVSGGGFTGGNLTSALNEARADDIASAATTDIGAAVGNYVTVTGTTTITSLGTAPAGARRVVRFAGALTLTYNATNLILPTAASITTAAGDIATFVSEGAGAWRCITYLRADGTPLAGGGGGGLTGFTAALNTAAPNNTTNVSSLTASGGTTNQGFAIVPKGSGALAAAIPNDLTSGGNGRGAYAIDLQLVREAANQVASGAYSVLIGGAANRVNQTYGVLIGGYNNQCLGEFSAIIGGDYNIIAAGANYNFMGGGRSNQHQAGSYANVIGGGQGNVTSNSAIYATIAGGLQNTVSASYGAVTGGQGNLVSGQYSRAGGQGANDRGVQGADAFASGVFSTAGSAQARRVILRSDTTDATTEAATTTNAAAAATNQMVLTDSSALHVTGRAVVREQATGDCAAFSIKALVRRGSGAGTTAVVGQSVTQEFADAGATTWAMALVADTTNGAVRINVTGEAAHNLRWVVELMASEVVG